MERTEAELIAAAVQGDPASFEPLIQKYSLRVFATARRYARLEREVEDIVQEVWIKAYQKLASFRGDAPFEHWLMRMAVRTCYDELRRTRRRGESSIGDLSEEEAAYLHERLRDLSASGNVEGAAISRDLANKLLSRLRPDDRMVLALLKLEELSIAEISSLTGWTIAKVKMRSHRAQRGLRQMLRKLL